MNRTKHLLSRRMAQWIGVLLLLGSTALPNLEAADKAPSISLESGKSQVDSRFVVTGLPESLLNKSTKWSDEQWKGLFSVHTVSDQQVSPTPLLGDYGVSDGKVKFAPRYPLRKGVTYRAILRV